MRNLKEANVTGAALGNLENCADPRLKDVMARQSPDKNP